MTDIYAQPASSADAAPVTLVTLRRLKKNRQKIVCLTAYDASFAAVLDASGVDLVLVGDSLGMVIQGHASTIPVTIDHMVYHTQLVARGLKRALLVADLPFLSYCDPQTALLNAGRLLREGGAHMVKLEGNATQAMIVEALAGQGIPVCAHLGLRPQSQHKIGGFRVAGRSEAEANRMVEDAKQLEAAGADLLLLECVPTPLATRITEAARVPVIGIGAGPTVDGQILVLYDILGLGGGVRPRFAETFLSGGRSIAEAVVAYAEAVRSGNYPQPEHGFE
ncbi:MAG: 3-methyl-2-oxobutanoate hydroxymethyltransferase [Gammaproteobacteria bacterium]